MKRWSITCTPSVREQIKNQKRSMALIGAFRLIGRLQQLTVGGDVGPEKFDPPHIAELFDSRRNIRYGLARRLCAAHRITVLLSHEQLVEIRADVRLFSPNSDREWAQLVLIFENKNGHGTYLNWCGPPLVEIEKVQK